jgi:hypothetical protein
VGERALTLLADQPQQQADDLNIKGRAQRRRDEELLLLLLLLLDDVAEAEAYWKRLAPDGFKGLPAARTPPQNFSNVPESVATSRVPAFDPRTLQYVKTLGEVIPAEDVRAAVLSVIVKAQAEIRRDTLAMMFGAMDLGEWQDRMMQFVKRLHVSTAAVGAGGWRQIPAEQLALSSDRIPRTINQVNTLGDSIAFHGAKVQRFAEQIENRAHGADHPAAIERRVLLYGESAYPGFEMLRRSSAIVNGMLFEENVLSEAEHCKAEPGDAIEDCPTQTQKGVVRIGTLVPIGRRLCSMMCKCRLKFSRV